MTKLKGSKTWKTFNNSTVHHKYNSQYTAQEILIKSRDFHPTQRIFQPTSSDSIFQNNKMLLKKRIWAYSFENKWNSTSI